MEAPEVAASSVEVIYPNQNRIDELGGMIEQFEGEKIKESLMKKEGEIYELISKRGKLNKKNYENRIEIAKLNRLIAKASSEDKEKLESVVKEGKVDEPFSLESVDSSEFSKLANRCGIVCSVAEGMVCGAEPEEKEKAVYVDNKMFWFAGEEANAVEEKMKRIDQLRGLLQINFAKRHVIEFNETEEETYNSMQKEYIELVREKDEMLKSL